MDAFISGVFMFSDALKFIGCRDLITISKLYQNLSGNKTLRLPDTSQTRLNSLLISEQKLLKVKKCSNLKLISKHVPRFKNCPWKLQTRHREKLNLN